MISIYTVHFVQSFPACINQRGFDVFPRLFDMVFETLRVFAVRVPALLGSVKEGGYHPP
jgi:hypothetical protein